MDNIKSKITTSVKVVKFREQAKDHKCGELYVTKGGEELLLDECEVSEPFECDNDEAKSERLTYWRLSPNRKRKMETRRFTSSMRLQRT